MCVKYQLFKNNYILAHEKTMYSILRRNRIDCAYPTMNTSSTGPSDTPLQSNTPLQTMITFSEQNHNVLFLEHLIELQSFNCEVI